MIKDSVLIVSVLVCMRAQMCVLVDVLYNYRSRFIKTINLDR